MRLVILTSSRQGFGAFCLPALARAAGIEVALVVYSEGRQAKRSRYLRRKAAKAARIGLLGTLNGMRMRKWFKDDVRERLRIEPVDAAAARAGVPFAVTPTINADRTVELFVEAGADLGLSLGNPYIGPRIYCIPREGMLNVHHEVLPDFQGAQSVLWQLYHGSRETGWTIHEIDRTIDTGRILYQERMPIALRPTVRETVTESYARLYEASAAGLVRVVQDHAAYAAAARAQQGGRRYTTPSMSEYYRIWRNHRRLLAAS